MRGKLRDKRTETRRDKLKRDLMERRRSIKRESRTAVALSWQNQLLHDDDDDAAFWGITDQGVGFLPTP